MINYLSNEKLVSFDTLNIGNKFIQNDKYKESVFVKIDDNRGADICSKENFLPRFQKEEKVLRVFTVDITIKPVEN